MSGLFEEIATSQPAFYRAEIASAERFYVRDGDSILAAKDVDAVAEIENRWREYGVRIPFDHIAINYADTGIAVCKWFNGDSQWLAENNMQGMYGDTGVLVIGVITAIGGLHMSPYYLMLRPNEPLVRVMVENADDKPSEDKIALLRVFAFGVANTITQLHNMRTEYVDWPPKVQKKREKKGKVPLVSYHRLLLAGDKSVVKRRGDGAHASPAYHKRRGHFRRYQSGKIVWIRDMMVGSPENGIALKDYVL